MVPAFSNFFFLFNKCVLSISSIIDVLNIDILKVFLIWALLSHILLNTKPNCKIEVLTKAIDAYERSSMLALKEQIKIVSYNLSNDRRE